MTFFSHTALSRRENGPPLGWRGGGTYLGQIVLGGHVRHERQTLGGAVQHLDGDGGQQEQAGGLHDARAHATAGGTSRTGRKGARKNARRLKNGCGNGNTSARVRRCGNGDAKSTTERSGSGRAGPPDSTSAVPFPVGRR